MHLESIDDEPVLFLLLPAACVTYRRYVSDPDLALVGITVDREYRDAYLPLPSWPPAE